ncbi:unnamed protein product [Amoebophrya sp. A120]|nr:unnamed protein product [Amoebophrya sp. A120]|eukprot:GSA120T00001503001.1
MVEGVKSPAVEEVEVPPAEAAVGVEPDVEEEEVMAEPAEEAVAPEGPKLPKVEDKLGKIKLPGVFLPNKVSGQSREAALKFKPLAFDAVEVIPGHKIQPTLGKAAAPAVEGEQVDDAVMEGEVAPVEGELPEEGAEPKEPTDGEEKPVEEEPAVEEDNTAKRVSGLLENFGIKKIAAPGTVGEGGVAAEMPNLISAALENPLIQPVQLNKVEVPAVAQATAGKPPRPPRFGQMSQLPFNQMPKPKLSQFAGSAGTPLTAEKSSAAAKLMRAGVGKVGYSFGKLLSAPGTPAGGPAVVASPFTTIGGPGFGLPKTAFKPMLGAGLTPANTENLVKHVSVNSDSLLTQFNFDGDFRLDDKPVFIDCYESVDDGTSLWDAGIVLGQYLAAFKDLYQGDCLELGCGTGIAGICRAVTCPDTKVILSDYETIVHVTDNNVALNQLQDQVTVMPYDWEQEFPIPLEEGGNFPYSFVIASDVMWHPTHVAPFFQGLLKCTTAGMKVVLGQCSRAGLDLYPDIQAEAEATGFEVESTTPSMEMELPFRGHSQCSIWVLTRLEKPVSAAPTPAEQ